MNLLEVRNLSVHFPVRRGLWERSKEWVRAVDDVSFDIQPGETLGLVGESGCGKTSLGRAVIRLIEPTAGSIQFEGEDLTRLEGLELRRRRRHFQMVFQDPYGSLDPRMTVEQIVGEALDIHHLATTRNARQQRVQDLLRAVGLDARHARYYPHEFSGGQRQRIGIARALAVEPRLIVCDEPVSALDVSIQAQIINLLRDLQAERGVAYLFIAHDLAVVEHISRRVMVMYLGKIVEMADAKTICCAPLHPYTRALVASVPKLNRDATPAHSAVTGDLPSPLEVQTGCPYHSRCPIAEERCRIEIPPLRQLAPGHGVACHLAEKQKNYLEGRALSRP